ncbi:MAG: hypothetical protein JST20_00445 [Bacteroidetes bacterium]|nr:hypothetical protein [Bacteroidota bacterium]
MTTLLEERKSTFITLNNKTIAEYCFIFRINDAYSINQFSNFSFKQQLLFQRLENLNQQLNLTFVDSVFSNILADVVLEVFINKISTFDQYINSKYKVKLVDEKDESSYFKYKFYNFINMLLYSDIVSKDIIGGEVYSDRVYCLKNKHSEIEYFSIYEQSTLQLRLIDELKLKIDYDSSTIANQEVKLCLKILY